MAEIILNATIRKTTGRKPANDARRDGSVPGVFYLGNETNVPILVKKLDMRSIIYTSETHIIKLKLDDGSENSCILKDAQFDPITDNLMHFDLLGIVAGEKIRVEVPIVLHGTPVGVKDEGGMLQHSLHKVEVEVLPTDMPEHIELNVENLHVGESLTIADIQMPGVLIHVDPSVSIASVSAPRGEEAAEGEEPSEPKVVGEDSTEG